MHHFLIAIVILFFVQTVGAADLVVEPDGSGDFPTIQAAIDAAADGDVILLADGVFVGTGNTDLSYIGKSLTIRSQSGDPEQCTIDCQGSASDPHRAFVLEYHEDAWRGLTLHGIAIRNGWAGNGGAIYSELCAWGGIQSCVFLDNHAVGSGGAICYPFLDDTWISWCDFIGNSAGRVGAIDCGQGPATISNCTFVGNSASSFVGAIRAIWTDIEVTGCLFDSNTSRHTAVAGIDGIARFSGCVFVRNSCSEGPAIARATSGPTWELSGCTFAGNSGEYLMYCGLSDDDGIELTDCTFAANEVSQQYGLFECENTNVVLGNCIITSTSGGHPLVGIGIHSNSVVCCDLYGNEAGDWIPPYDGMLGVDGNISADPQFCYSNPLDQLDWSIEEDSPCAPDISACGAIGAWSADCEDTAPVRVSWGEVKTLYR